MTQSITTIADGVRLRVDIFTAHIERTEGCWLWTGPLDRGGYGRYSAAGAAHRVAYRLWVGPIAEGLTVDHVCFEPKCVRPDHLRLLPPRENYANQRAAIKTHCQNGHEYTPDNTYLRPTGRGRRQCRACRSAAVQRYRASRSVA